MLLIIALLIGVIPTAYANPPDPSWVAGYWDDDDFDNTVVFITGAYAIHVTVPVHARALFVARARLDPTDPAACPTPLLRSSLHPRAPPRHLPHVSA
jgi:hypothetical protein